MTKRKRVVQALALGGAILVECPSGGQVFPPTPPEDPGYQADCVIGGRSAVDGYVLNRNPVPLEVDGNVRFTFYAADAAAHPVVSVPASATIAPGRRVLVAHAGLPFTLGWDEACRFDVGDAVR
ncbi:MAG: hypothetical protein WC969_06380 [Elusimicrobiota bacterium]|jgi:hypothetical protein